MNAQAQDLRSGAAAPIQTQWPAPLSGAEWDRRFPGVLDSVSLLGSTANTIMQLANPAVGYGVVESRVPSGSILHNPRKRSRTTLTYLAVATLGTTEEKLAYRRAVNTSHAQVYSTEQSPVKYNAFDPELQLWVAACLYKGYADGMHFFRGAVSREQQARLYEALEPLATTLQVRPGMWPADLDAFDAYWENAVARIAIDDRLRDFLDHLATLDYMGPRISRVFGRLNRFITAGYLPERFRQAMGYDWGPRQQRRFDRLVAVIGAINRLLPLRMRQSVYENMLRDFRSRLQGGSPLV